MHKERQYYFQPGAATFGDDRPISHHIDEVPIYNGGRRAVGASDPSELLSALVADRRLRAFQWRIAEHMGIGAPALSRFEKESEQGRQPTWEKLQQYANALGYELQIACYRKAD